jgi:outer membrane protein assembly factor BamE (lipoprotein component of BamABCDE complex)
MKPFVSARPAALCLALAVGLAGCIGETRQRGYLVSDMALEQVPVGSSREQVLLVLGTPSTTANFTNEVFYYISQTTSQPVRFLNPSVTDQRVLAVYFDDEGQVARLANYGLQDGRVFDFVSRTTPTSGSDVSFITQILSNAGNAAAGAAGAGPSGVTRP